MRNREVLSLVEHSWAGARQCSLALGERGIAVTHLIKGRVSREELAMIAPRSVSPPKAAQSATADCGPSSRETERGVAPAPIRVVSATRLWFRPRWWLMAAGLALRGRLGWCLVDHERTVRELTPLARWLGARVVEIRDHDAGYDLFIDGDAVSLNDAFK